MKKLACFLIVCSVAGTSFAFQSKGKVSPTVDNPSITKSKKDMSKQVKTFDNKSRYSSVVKGHGGNHTAKQQAKNQDKGKGL